MNPPPVMAMEDRTVDVHMVPEPGIVGEEAMRRGMPAMAVLRIRPSVMLVRRVKRGGGMREMMRDERPVGTRMK